MDAHAASTIRVRKVPFLAMLEDKVHVDADMEIWWKVGCRIAAELVKVCTAVPPACTRGSSGRNNLLVDRPLLKPQYGAT